MTTGPGGGSGSGPGGGGGTGPGRDYALNAGLLDVADALNSPRLPLAHAAGLMKVLLTDARDLADAGLDLPTTPADNAMALQRLASIGFHLDRALNELRHLTPARQSDQSSAAVGLNAIATPGGPGPTPHWADLVKPEPDGFELPAAPPAPRFLPGGPTEAGRRSAYQILRRNQP